MEIVSLICSVSHALLGRVTPNLRAVYITFQNEETVLSFYFDTPPSEDEQELASLADTDFIADFPNVKSNFQILTVPQPGRIPNQGRCIYHRFEGDVS